MQSTDHLAASRYARMRWNTPLSQEHAALLLQRLDVRPRRARARSRLWLG